MCVYVRCKSSIIYLCCLSILWSGCPSQSLPTGERARRNALIATQMMMHKTHERRGTHARYARTPHQPCHPLLSPTRPVCGWARLPPSLPFSPLVGKAFSAGWTKSDLFPPVPRRIRCGSSSRSSQLAGSDSCVSLSLSGE